jgi:hypothetical protein
MLHTVMVLWLPPFLLYADWFSNGREPEYLVASYLLLAVDEDQVSSAAARRTRVAAGTRLKDVHGIIADVDELVNARWTMRASFPQTERLPDVLRG